MWLKLKEPRQTAGFSLWFHVPRCNCGFGYGYCSKSQSTRANRRFLSLVPWSARGFWHSSSFMRRVPPTPWQMCAAPCGRRDPQPATTWTRIFPRIVIIQMGSTSLLGLNPRLALSKHMFTMATGGLLMFLEWQVVSLIGLCLRVWFNAFCCRVSPFSGFSELHL